MKKEHHATIIGGGAVGLSIAWELARRGFRVTLFERGQIGQATSRAGTGILPAANLETATDPIDQLRGLSHNLFPDWIEELSSITGIDCGFRRCGGWYLADTKGERAAMLGMTSYWDELGIKCESVPLGTLTSREPCLASWARRSTDASAWWVKDECQIRPPRYLRALEHACRGAGVELIPQTSVSDIRTTGLSAEALVHDRWYQSDSIIVCAGAWTGKVAKSLRLDVSLVPIRGQILLLKTDMPLLHSVVNVGQRYVVCRDDGYTLVGSCEEEVGFELGTTDAILRSLLEFAVSLIPELQSAEEIDAWSGLRPLTFDGFPMIGRAPGTRNVYVAAGHFRSGLHLSPGTAVVLADLITNQQPQLDLGSFRIGKQQSKSSALPERIR
jgi:glycine oxidase